MPSFAEGYGWQAVSLSPGALAKADMPASLGSAVGRKWCAHCSCFDSGINELPDHFYVREQVTRMELMVRNVDKDSARRLEVWADQQHGRSMEARQGAAL